jgi:pimeloyl-ACP methyl ester carboxylesterase
MPAVTSADTTAIAYERFGAGTPLVLVAGAFNDRATTAPLAAALGGHLLALNADRRGRGESGDAPDYAVEREIEDLAALIEEAGGSAAVFGYSSGANLALQAAAAGVSITKLVLYEPPYVLDESHPRPPVDLDQQLAQLVADGKRGEAVELYQARAIGMPPEVVARLRNAPFRPALEGVAHTLAYDAAIIGDLSFPAEMIAGIQVPALVIDGDQSPPVMRTAATAVADTLPNSQHRSLRGQGHDIDPAATAPVIVEFLAE